MMLNCQITLVNRPIYIVRSFLCHASPALFQRRKAFVYLR
jgi:hypothetical protein